MSRFFYTHFGESVPHEIECEYNKLRRKEMWNDEKEKAYRASSVNFYELEPALADPSSLPSAEKEKADNERKANRLKYLSIGLAKMKKDSPVSYTLIKEYYCSASDDKFTYPMLAARHGLTTDIVRYRIRLAKEALRNFIISHENDCE